MSAPEEKPREDSTSMAMTIGLAALIALGAQVYFADLKPLPPPAVPTPAVPEPAPPKKPDCPDNRCPRLPKFIEEWFSAWF